MAEEEATIPDPASPGEAAELQVPAGPDDIQEEWQALDAGLKSRAMRAIHEEQQKAVVELGRRIMDIQNDIAISLARVKAAADLNRADDQQRIWESEVKPRREELQELQRRIKEERTLLDAYESMGKGII